MSDWGMLVLHEYAGSAKRDVCVLAELRRN